MDKYAKYAALNVGKKTAFKTDIVGRIKKRLMAHAETSGLQKQLNEKTLPDWKVSDLVCALNKRYAEYLCEDFASDRWPHKHAIHYFCADVRRDLDIELTADTALMLLMALRKDGVLPARLSSEEARMLHEVLAKSEEVDLDELIADFNRPGAATVPVPSVTSAVSTATDVGRALDIQPDDYYTKLESDAPPVPPVKRDLLSPPAGTPEKVIRQGMSAGRSNGGNFVR